VPLVALAAGAALGAVVRPLASRPPRPLALTPRVAAIALLGQAGLQLWLDSAPVLTTPLRAAALLALAALTTTILASFAILTLRLRRPWLIAGVVAWALGWIASTADLGPLFLGVLGAPYPLGLHQLRGVDPALVQIIATLGGLAIGAALVLAMREARFRHSAMILLASFAVFGVLAAIREHRIELATNLASIVPIRNDRDLAVVIAHGALAGVLWMYWRRVVSSSRTAA
jgi:hypothetical protein